jgi:hypothetical protein
MEAGAAGTGGTGIAVSVLTFRRDIDPMARRAREALGDAGSGVALRGAGLRFSCAIAAFAVSAKVGGLCG